MSSSAMTIPVEADAQDMAMLMREKQLEELVITGADEEPIGIVTERDLVYKVLPTAEVGMTAQEVMSSPPVTIQTHEHLYQAVFLMMRHRVRRLVVVDSAGRLAGTLSIRDLVSLEGYEEQVIGNRISKARTVEELCEVRGQISDFIRRLYMGEVNGRSLVEILTEQYDLLTRRALTLAHQRLRLEHTGPAKSFAWISFGSEGRREQVLQGDQDNGIIIEDGADDKALNYYRRLAGKVNMDLDRCGFELCQGGVMAREDKYFGTLSEWKGRVTRMISGYEDGALLRDLSIYLDLRLVDGDQRLVDELWDFTLKELLRSPQTVQALARDAVAKPVPLNFIGRFQFEKTSSGKKGINLKRYALMPIVAAAKVLAIDEGLRLTSTAQRIRALQEANVVEEATAAELLQADEFLLKLKIQGSLPDAFHEESEERFIFPEEWAEWERQNLRRAFRAIEQLTGVLRFRFPV